MPETMPETPTDMTIEPTWLIEATYAPDAAATRVPFRVRHLARLGELKDAGVVIEAAALDIARDDIYMANGVWVELRARPFGRAVRSDAAGS